MGYFLIYFGLAGYFLFVDCSKLLLGYETVNILELRT
jgi:hypothetical protein